MRMLETKKKSTYFIFQNAENRTGNTAEENRLNGRPLRFLPQTDSKAKKVL